MCDKCYEPELNQKGETIVLFERLPGDGLPWNHHGEVPPFVNMPKPVPGATRVEIWGVDAKIWGYFHIGPLQETATATGRGYESKS